MKKLLTFIIILTINASVFAGTLYWIGSSNNAAPGDWATAANWSTTAGGAAGADVPNGSTFADVVFSQNAAVVFTAVPTDLGTLTVTNSVTVRFMCATSLALFATTPTILTVDAGSKLELVTSAASGTSGGPSLNIKGTCTVDGIVDLLGGSGSRIVQAIGNTLNVSGTLRLGNVLIGGVASNAGTLSISGTLNMNANSNFIIAKTFASGIPLANWDVTSTLTINDLTAASSANNSAMSWSSAANTMLGNFVWNCPSQPYAVAVGFQSNSSGYVATVKGDFTITSSNGKTIPMASNNNQTKTTVFKGNFTSSTAAQIDMTSSFATVGSGAPTWQFEKNVSIGGSLNNGANLGTSTISFIGSNTGLGGSGAQTFSCGPITANKITMIVNNSNNGLTAGSTLSIFKKVTCSSGKIVLGNNNIIVAGTVEGSASGGWIVTDGTGTLTVQAVGTGGKLFPVGTSITDYNEMAITNAAGTNDFTVSVKSSFTNAPLNVANTCSREWNVVSSSAGATLEMQAATGAPCGAVTNVIGHYVGGAWVESATVPGPYNGLPSADFTSFSPFSTGAACAFGSTSSSNAAVASGNWSASATWTCGVVPTLATANVGIGGAATVVNLDVSNPSVKSLTFSNGGKLQLGANNLTITSDITGAAAAGYVITDGAGKLIVPTSTSVATILPIGVSASSYDPLSIKPTSAVNFAAKVSATIANPLSTNGSNKNLIVSREWDIIPASTPGSTALIFTASGTALNANGTAYDFATPTAGQMGHWNQTLNAGVGAWERFTTTYASANKAWTVAAYTGTYSPFVVTSPSAILAVEFTTINAYAKGNSNFINFATASEKDAKEFIIERTIDNKIWTTIGTKAAIGGQFGANYAFEDATPVALSYYRIRSVAANGSSQTSKAIAVKRNGGKLAIIAVFPMPYTEGASVDFSVGTTTTVDVTITDIVGRVVYSKAIKTTEGTNSFLLNATNLTSGSYILTLNDGETTATQRIVKQ